MAIIVQKYGGTSVANAERIQAVARRVKEAVGRGDRIAVVISAMAGETERLIALSKAYAAEPKPQALDLLLATGELKSCSLLSIALEEEGVPTKLFTGLEAGFVTDAHHGRARILRVEPAKVIEAMGVGAVAIVAGFQGATEAGEITTIGRGGSDTSAVALAAAIGADRCEIYSDVDGVLTSDPRIVPKARVIDKISYEELMEFADAGAKVMHARSVEMAAKYSVPLQIRSAFSHAAGTRVLPESQIGESLHVSGITCNKNEAKIAIRKVPDKVGINARIFARIARAGINVDLIIQNISAEGFADLTFTCEKDDLRRAMTIACAAAKEVEAGEVEAAGDIAKISAVGLGMRSHAGIAHRMFSALAREEIAIQMIGTSEIKLSVVIDIRHADNAVRILHDEFGLGAPRGHNR